MTGGGYPNQKADGSCPSLSLFMIKRPQGAELWGGGGETSKYAIITEPNGKRRSRLQSS
jgi:hypothetical protein